MPITEEEREERYGGIWSSDMAALMGVNPKSTSHDIYLHKRRRVDPISIGEAADTGTRFEPVIMDWAEEELGPLVRNLTYWRPELRLGSHLDGETAGIVKPVEVKTSGLHGRVWGEWGDEGTDQVPPWTIIQCQVHMICMPSDPDVCHVPAFLGGRGFLMYHVPRSERLCEAIKARAVAFWENHVVKDVPPEDSEPSLEVVEHLRRVPKTTVSCPMEVLTRHNTLKQAIKDAETAYEPARVDLLKYMGDADAVDAGDAGGATYFGQSRKGFNVKQLTKDHPEIAAQYVTESRHRVLRTQKPK